MSINAVNYPGCYAASAGRTTSPTNPQVTTFVNGINDEIKFKQANVKIEFLQHLVNEHKELPAPEREAAENMLRDAQRELAQLKCQLDNKYCAR